MQDGSLERRIVLRYQVNSIQNCFDLGQLSHILKRPQTPKLMLKGSSAQELLILILIQPFSIPADRF